MPFAISEDMANVGRIVDYTDSTGMEITYNIRDKKVKLLGYDDDVEAEKIIVTEEYSCPKVFRVAIDAINDCINPPLTVTEGVLTFDHRPETDTDALGHGGLKAKPQDSVPADKIMVVQQGA
ncbi:hypothetical protein SYNGFB01_03945 [Synechococcus sp. GFB01]|nr:hypothetical protein SYNGFB01_03945 [Synechococcus sp. GFB01]